MDATVLKLTSARTAPTPRWAWTPASPPFSRQRTNSGVVSRRFDEAVKDEDLASIERFFKLFPLLNMHKEGLQNFNQYLCTKLVDTSKKNLKQAVDTQPGDKRAYVIFAVTLTLLFEGVARTVDIHQPLIETYCGPGRLVTVFGMLQVRVQNL